MRFFYVYRGKFDCRIFEDLKQYKSKKDFLFSFPWMRNRAYEINKLNKNIDIYVPIEESCVKRIIPDWYNRDVSLRKLDMSYPMVFSYEAVFKQVELFKDIR